MRAMRLIEPAKAEYSWRLKFFDHLNLERKISFKGVKGKTSESKKRAESYRASIEAILLDKISNRPMSDESFKFLSDNPAIAAKLREWDIIGTDAMGSTETLTSLMQKWVASRMAHGLKKATIVRTSRAVREGIRGCKWTYISDIDGDELLAYYLNTGICANTAKSYLYDFKNFASWLVDQGYVRESPLRKTKGPKVRGKVRENIELPVEIEAKLYQYLMSPEAPRRNKTAPRVRAIIYKLGTIQGLREQEVVQLTCEEVHLDGDQPFIAISEAKTKTKKSASAIPVRASILPELRQHINNIKEGRLFPGLCWGCNLAKMLRADLADAGLPTGDGQGNNYTYHGLRATCASRLARDPAVTPAEVQQFLRHETLAMTSKYYIKTDLKRLAAAVNGEKSLAPALPQQSISSTTLANVPDNAGVNNSVSKDNEIKDLGQGNQDSASTSDNNDGVYRFHSQNASNPLTNQEDTKQEPKPLSTSVASGSPALSPEDLAKAIALLAEAVKAKGDLARLNGDMDGLNKTIAYLEKALASLAVVEPQKS